MRLELACNFLALNIDEFDLAVTAANSNLLASLVELADVSNCVTRVDVEDLLDHPDVPHFDDSVRVTRRDVLPANGEAAVIDGVQVAEERLHGQASPHVPNRNASVC